MLEQKRMTGQQLKKLFLEQEPQEFFKIKNLRKDFEKCISLIGSKFFQGKRGDDLIICKNKKSNTGFALLRKVNKQVIVDQL